MASLVRRFKQVAETIGLLKTLDFVNFGGFRGFRFLDPPLDAHIRPVLVQSILETIH